MRLVLSVFRRPFQCLRTFFFELFQPQPVVRGMKWFVAEHGESGHLG